jgi:cyclophilin family peptidyl-prolyl cis-trans isomerase
MRITRTMRTTRPAAARLIFTWGAIVALAAFTGLSARQALAQTAPAKPSGVRATPAKADASKPGPAPQKPAAVSDAAAGPAVTMETAKGTIVFQLYAKDAPKSVAHILELVKSGFYRNQRIIRVVPGQLVQFGDKQSRDFTRRDWWGRGLESGSGHPIGVAEISKTRTFKLGTVGLAHAGDPAQSDSQMFVALRPIPQWSGQYTIIGQVTSGLDVLPKLKVEDVIKNITIAGGT